MSTMTETRPDHRTRPRKKRPPCYRDQQILLQYLGGRSQDELAAEHRVSQPRISKILQRVRKWRANRRPQEAGELTHEEQQRLDYWQRRQMQEDIYRRSLRDYDRAPKQLTTKKVKTDKDGNKIREVTTRDILPPVGLLKTAQRSAENLAKEADRQPPPQVQDPAADRAEAFRRAKWLLIELRGEAERAGLVPRSREHQGDNFCGESLVEYWLAALLGDLEREMPDDVHLRDGDSLGALLGFYRQRKAERRRENVASGWITADEAAAADAREVAAMGFGSSANGYDGNVNESAQVDVEPQVAAERGEENLAAAEGTDATDALPVADAESVGCMSNAKCTSAAKVPCAPLMPPTETTPESDAVRALVAKCQHLQEWQHQPGVSVANIRRMLAEKQAELLQLLIGTGPLSPGRQAGSSSDAAPANDNTAPPPPLQPLPSETRYQRQKREAADKAERHRLHMLRLDALREAQRHGLPTQFVFDPEDGPLPPRGGYFA